MNKKLNLAELKTKANVINTTAALNAIKGGVEVVISLDSTLKTVGAITFKGKEGATLS